MMRRRLDGMREYTYPHYGVQSASYVMTAPPGPRPISLYAYDSLGNQIRSGQDINRNDTLDLASIGV